MPCSAVNAKASVGGKRWPLRLVSCVFFFQAEDGIRDYKVTGVQTCALPICWVAFVRGMSVPGRGVVCVTGSPAFRPCGPCQAFAASCPLWLVTPRVARRARGSEERRVGKEGRSRWAPYH